MRQQCYFKTNHKAMSWTISCLITGIRKNCLQSRLRKMVEPSLSLNRACIFYSDSSSASSTPPLYFIHCDLSSLLTACTPAISPSRVCSDMPHPSPPYIQLALSITIVSNSLPKSLGSSCCWCSRQNSWSVGSRVKEQVQFWFSLFLQLLGPQSWDGQLVISSERLQSSLAAPISVLLKDMSQLLTSVSTYSTIRYSKSSQKLMKFFLRASSKNIFQVSCLKTESKDLVLPLEQNSPSPFRMARKESTSSSDTIFSWGLLLSLKPVTPRRSWTPPAALSRILSPVTCSSSPLMTRKQKSTSTLHLSPRNPLKTLIAVLLWAKCTMESRRLTKFCSILTLSRSSQRIWRQNQSMKLIQRMLWDFFLWSFQNFQQVDSTISWSSQAVMRLGQMQTSTQGCRAQNRASSPSLATLLSIFLLMGLDSSRFFSSFFSSFSFSFLAPQCLPLAWLSFAVGGAGLASCMKGQVPSWSCWVLTLKWATNQLSFLVNSRLDWASSQTQNFFWFSERVDKSISILVRQLCYFIAGII